MVAIEHGSTQKAALPLGSSAFWRAYAITMRPYLCFVSGAAGLVGLALPHRLAAPAFAAAFAAFFLSYGFGQALTDVFQTDTDALSSPYRPLTQGRLTKGQVTGVSLLGLALCGLVFAALDPWTLAASALGVFGLIAYTPFKRRWWGGPLWNAWVVGALTVIGFLAAGGGAGALAGDRKLWVAVASVLLSYAVFVLLGYFKDIAADRATGYRTLPVVAGWRASVFVSLGLALGAAAASAWLLTLLGAAQRPLDASLAAALGGWLVGLASLLGAHPFMLRLRQEREAHRAIAWTVRGFVLLHLGEAAVAWPVLTLPALVFYALFELVLASRPERSQV